jgi:hypothetical protein
MFHNGSVSQIDSQCVIRDVWFKFQVCGLMWQGIKKSPITWLLDTFLEKLTPLLVLPPNYAPNAGVALPA